MLSVVDEQSVPREATTASTLFVHRRGHAFWRESNREVVARSTARVRGRKLDSLPGLEHLGRSPLERACHSLALRPVPFRILVFVDLALCSPLSHSRRTFRHGFLRGRTLARVNSFKVELPRFCFRVLSEGISRWTWCASCLRLPVGDSFC